MRWRDHLKGDAEMVADGFKGLLRTLAAMLFGVRESRVCVRWRSWRFRVERDYIS